MSSKKHIKTYKFEDPELLKLLEEKNKAVNEGKRINRKIEAFQNKLNQAGHKVQQYKDKIVPMFNERIKPKMEIGEFDDIQTVEKKGSKIVVTVVDRVEEFKDWYLNQQKEREENQDDNEIKQDANDQ